jgi:hypothetical protein
LWGYAQTEAGFTAYARLAGQASTATIGYAFAAHTAPSSCCAIRTRITLVPQRPSMPWSTSSCMAAVPGPVVAGVMLGARFDVGFIAMLTAGCALMAFMALAVERRIPDQANGIAAPAVELSRA